MSKRKPLERQETRRGLLQAALGGRGSGPRRYEVLAITAGEGNGYEYSAAVIEAATPLFDGVTVLVDHPQLGEMWSRTGNRSIRNVLGILEGAYYDAGSEGINAVLRVSEGPNAGWFIPMVDDYIAGAERGEQLPDVGLSAVVDITVREREVVEIKRVISVDAVFDPARGGRFIRALNQQRVASGEYRVSSMKGEGGTVKPKKEEGKGNGEALAEQEKGKTTSSVANGGGVPVQGEERREAVLATRSVTQAEAQRPADRQEVRPEADGVAVMAGAVLGEQVPGGLVSASLQTRNASAEVEGTAFLSALSDGLLEMRLQAANLPDPVAEMLRGKYGGRPLAIVALDAEIEALQSAWAASVAASGPQVRGVGASGIAMGLAPMDRLNAAMEKLCGLTPESEALQDVQPLSGIRELYLMLTGDFNFTGIFDKDRVALANVTTSTMTSLVKNAFNKVILDYFNAVDRWWEPVVSEEQFGSMKDMTLITLGGFENLPTVAEGAAYTELSWSDEEEVVSFVKKGAYVGVTLEMMDKDETRKFRAIPRKLAMAGYRTLSGLVSALFTDNSGVGPYWPASQAVLRLFDASYGNLGSSALSTSSWDACIQAMYEMTEATSGAQMGIRPAYLLVPIELEKTARVILESDLESGTADNDKNVRQGSSRVVTVPLWTNASNWAAVADPRMYPGIVVGYRYGRMPEVFISGQETVGSMFTNDEMRVKARFIVAVGVGDYRSLYKANI